MKQITVISGKGGTGKTTLVGAFASLAENKVLADCDVDASDLHLILEPEIKMSDDFKGLKTACIDESKCIKCGKCYELCRFNAIENFRVNEMLCEGCGVCEFICPVNAITMKEKIAGKVFISETRFGPLCHARLYPGEEASGKLVTIVRNKAKGIAEERNLDLIIIDGSPGIGCPVIASIGGVDLALIVTEPTVSGIHDLKRILNVTEHFGVKAIVCINKYDINTKRAMEIEDYCNENDIIISGKIPYDMNFTRAMVNGKTIMEYINSNNNISKIIKGIWDEINNNL